MQAIVSRCIRGMLLDALWAASAAKTRVTHTFAATVPCQVGQHRQDRSGTGGPQQPSGSCPFAGRVSADLQPLGCGPGRDRRSIAKVWLAPGRVEGGHSRVRAAERTRLHTMHALATSRLPICPRSTPVRSARKLPKHGQSHLLVRPFYFRSQSCFLGR